MLHSESLYQSRRSLENFLLDHKILASVFTSLGLLGLGSEDKIQVTLNEIVKELRDITIAELIEYKNQWYLRHN